MAVESHVFGGFSNVGIPLNELIQQQQQEQSQFLVSHQQLQTFQSSQKQSLFPPCEINNYNTSFVFSAVRNEPVETPMAYPDVLARQLENQRIEIDKFMNLQNERLKLALEVQKKHHMSSLIRQLESRVGMVLRQKDEELSQTRQRAVELQGCMKRMEIENLGWRRVVAASETMIANLKASIHQVTEKAAIGLQQQMISNNCDVEDAASCCADEAGEKKSKKRKTMKRVCKKCGNGDSSMLLLPCRHLCCCKACEASLYACPVCNSAKQGSIEALLS